MTRDSAADHVQLWLAATGLSYGVEAREAFIRAHPTLFGHAYELALRGYERWRRWQRRSDNVEDFAAYITPRHQRWMAESAPRGSLAPCLVGSVTSNPCWKTTRRSLNGSH
jgi:hypothetical protein